MASNATNSHISMWSAEAAYASRLIRCAYHCPSSVQEMANAIRCIGSSFKCRVPATDIVEHRKGSSASSLVLEPSTTFDHFIVKVLQTSRLELWTSSTLAFGVIPRAYSLIFGPSKVVLWRVYAAEASGASRSFEASASSPV